MAFQFTVSPGIPKRRVPVPKPTTESIEIPTLSLAPFTPNVKLCFENILVGTFATQKLILENPSARSIEVWVKNIPLPEKCVKLSWLHHIIPAKDTIVLEISWTPIAEESWRHIFVCEDGRHVKKDVAVTFKSITAKKKNTSKTKRGKCSVVAKKVKVSPKRTSPKQLREQHKKSNHEVLLQKKTMPSITISHHDVFNSKNKENVDPIVKRIHTRKHNESELFISPRATTFNINSQDEEIRRGTFTVATAINKHILEPPNNYSKDISNDSLEMEQNLNTTLNIGNGHLSPNQAVMTWQLQSTPQLIKDINKLNLESSVLPFTPVSNIPEFIPSRYSTAQKPKTSVKQLFDNSKCTATAEINPNKELDNRDEHLANVSTETYVKGNVSTETYTVKNNLSTATYIKDNSVDSLTNINVTPNSTMKIIATSRSVSSLFGDTVNNTGNNLSPILKDSSMVHQANMSGDNIRSIIEANLWPNQEKRVLDFINEESIEDISVNFSQPLKRKSTSILDVSLPKKILLESSKRVPEHGQTLKWNKGKPVSRKPNYQRSIEYLDPFMEARVYQDQQWLYEQEIRFKKWLNALLTPPAELDSNVDGDPLDVAKLWQQCKHKSVPAAPSKEVVSSQYHTHNRLNSLRNSASKLFKSRQVTEVLDKALNTVESGKLSIRSDKDIQLDLGLQSEVMTLFLSYNPLWLRIGLETIYDMKIPLSSNSDIMGLSSFIMQRFFRDPFLVRKHKSVHSAKYIIDIKKFILKKFLVFVYFVDVAKTKVLIAHDPCLFCKNAPIKESREILLRFSRELLSAVGDVTRFLRFTGYTVSHTQKYIHEFDYSVINLGVDLRDGVRLTKVMEIILMQNKLTDGVRVPAISRLQKIHNMKIVFNALQQANFEIVGDITTKDIVDGHQDKTLSFLWQIIYKFHAPFLVKASVTIQTWWRSLHITIKRRILSKKYYLSVAAATKIQLWYKRLKLAHQLESLILWIKQRSQQKLQINSAIKIQSYIRMYSQKRKYCQIKHFVLTLQCRIRTYLVKQKLQQKVTAVIYIQAYVRMWIARTRYLKTRAAVIHIQQKYRAKYLMITELNRFQQLKITVICCQRRFRANIAMKIQHTLFCELKSAAIVIQKHFRANRAAVVERHHFLELKAAAIAVQRQYRANTAMMYHRTSYIRLKKATLTLQKQFRAHSSMVRERKWFLNLKATTIKIQQRFRATRAMIVQHAEFQELKKATLILQRQFRAHQAMTYYRTEFVNLKRAAITIQRKLRAHRAMKIQQKKFKELKKTACIIQQHYRAHRSMIVERKRFLNLKETTIRIQQRFRATRAMIVQRAKFQELKKATLILQQQFRARQAMTYHRTEFVNLKQAAITIQRKFRAHRAMKIQQKKFKQLKKAACIIQQHYRAHRSMIVERKRFLNLKETTIRIQQRFRATRAMFVQHSEFQELKKATLILQRQFRAHQAMTYYRTEFVNLKKAAITIQRKFRAHRAMKIEQKKFKELKEATCIIQLHYRARSAMVLERKRFLNMKETTIRIQQRFRATRAMFVQHAEFQELKKATLILQRQFRAHQAMTYHRTEFVNLKMAAITIQRKFRAHRAMKIQQNKFKELKEAACIIQQHYRAHSSMVLERKWFLNLKETTIIIQQRFRATRAMFAQHAEFQELKKATLILQRQFRAHQAMTYYRTEFVNLKKAAITIQRKFRAHRAMKIEQKKFKELKKATCIVQQHYRAHSSMVLERKRFLNLKETTVRIQQMFRATRAMIIQHAKFQELKKATLILQRQFRAHQAMTYHRTEFVNLKMVAITIQRKFRAHRAMKIQQKKFKQLKKAACIIQQHYRAHRSMIVEQKRFLNLKETTIRIQQRFRATRAMIVQHAKFQELKKATLILQRQFRAHQAMTCYRTEFVNLKKAAITIQRKFRAHRAMKIEQKKFKELKKATCIVQQHYRAHSSMVLERKRFLNLKETTVRIQQKFRATRAMIIQHAEFQELKKATLILQRQFRARQAMTYHRTEFVNLKIAAITIQRKFRAHRAMKIEHTNFKKLKEATCIIQLHYRARSSMVLERKLFLCLKETTITIQRRFRATRAMCLEHAKFLELKRATLIIQRRYRARRAMMSEHISFMNLRKAIILIQRVFRSYRERKSKIQSEKANKAANMIQRWYRNVKAIAVDRALYLNLKRTRSNSATKIQALWRGYKSREQHPELVNIRQKALKSTLNADPYNTLAQRRERAVQMLSSDRPTILQIIRALEDLEFITRRCKDTCLQMSRLLPEHLYLTINSTNRSPAEMQACTVATSILINFCKYQITSSAAWLPQYIDSILTVMNHCCDKEDILFSYLCTLIWMFAHNEEHKQTIISSPNWSQRILKIKMLCLRKMKMVSKMKYKTLTYFSSYDNLPLPSLFPDWGLDYPDRPRTFTNSLHGLKCLLQILGVE